MQMNAHELAELSINVYGAMQKYEEFKQLMELALVSPHETILEIGSGRGGTLWAWSHLPHNRTVISVDLPGGAFGGGLTDEDKERIQNWIDPKQNTFLCAMDSHDPATLKEVQEALSSVGDGLVDILCIDGDHTYEGVKKDFEMYSPLVRPGGVVVFHDICDHSSTAPDCQVEKFWCELIGERQKDIKTIGTWYEYVSEPNTWGGVGVLRW